MIINATITLTELQLREILCEYLQKKGLGSISHQDIQFNVEYVHTSPQRDDCGVHKFTGVVIKNVEVGALRAPRDERAEGWREN